jgi:hypothetical protein
VRIHRIATVVVSCFSAIAVSLSAREPKTPANTNAYRHGTTTCLQGSDGPGVKLLLRQNSRCEGRVSYPYLEVDIRELPVSAHKSISIGADNWAFRCPDPKDSCQQSLSGKVVFDHFEGTVGSQHLHFVPAGLPCFDSESDTGGFFIYPSVFGAW